MGNACAFEGVDAGAEPGGFASPPCTFEEFSASIETPQAASTEFRECAAYRVWRAPSAKPSSWSGISCLSEDAGTGSAKRCFELPDLDAKDCYVVMEVIFGRPAGYMNRSILEQIDFGPELNCRKLFRDVWNLSSPQSPRSPAAPARSLATATSTGRGAGAPTSAAPLLEMERHWLLHGLCTKSGTPMGGAVSSSYNRGSLPSFGTGAATAATGTGTSTSTTNTDICVTFYLLKSFAASTHVTHAIVKETSDLLRKLQKQRSIGALMRNLVVPVKVALAGAAEEVEGAGGAKPAQPLEAVAYVVSEVQKTQTVPPSFHMTQQMSKPISDFSKLFPRSTSFYGARSPYKPEDPSIFGKQASTCGSPPKTPLTAPLSSSSSSQQNQRGQLPLPPAKAATSTTPTSAAKRLPSFTASSATKIGGSYQVGGSASSSLFAPPNRTGGFAPTAALLGPPLRLNVALPPRAIPNFTAGPTPRAFPPPCSRGAGPAPEAAGAGRIGATTTAPGAVGTMGPGTPSTPPDDSPKNSGAIAATPDVKVDRQGPQLAVPRVSLDPLTRGGTISFPRPANFPSLPIVTPRIQELLAATPRLAVATPRIGFGEPTPRAAPRSSSFYSFTAPGRGGRHLVYPSGGATGGIALVSARTGDVATPSPLKSQRVEMAPRQQKDERIVTHVSSISPAKKSSPVKLPIAEGEALQARKPEKGGPGGSSPQIIRANKSPAATPRAELPPYLTKAKPAPSKKGATSLLQQTSAGGITPRLGGEATGAAVAATPREFATPAVPATPRDAPNTTNIEKHEKKATAACFPSPSGGAEHDAQKLLDKYRPLLSEIPCDLDDPSLKKFKGASVYIGASEVARNKKLLLSTGITHIVNAAAEVTNNLEDSDEEEEDQDELAEQSPANRKRSNSKHFEYLTFWFKDGKTEDISSGFFRTLEFSVNAFKRNPNAKILYHCGQGVSRSCTLCLVYLMWLVRRPMMEVLTKIQNSYREICRPNTGFMFQLLLWQKELGIQREIGGVEKILPEPRLYKVRCHHPKDPFLVLFAVEHRQSATLSLDPRFHYCCYANDRVLWWKGPQSNLLDDEVEKLLQTTAESHEKYLRGGGDGAEGAGGDPEQDRNRSGRKKLEIVEETSDDPADAFWKHLRGPSYAPPATAQPVRCRPENDDDFQLLATEFGKSPDLDKQTADLGTPRTPMTSPRTPPVEDSPDATREKMKPELYRCSDWDDPFTMFDMDDLESENVHLMFASDETGRPTIFLWQGSLAEPAETEQIVADFLEFKGLAADEIRVAELQKERKETDEFLDIVYSV